MKKLLCLVLSLALLCFAGCSNDKDISSSSNGKTAVKDSVASGKLGNIKYGLGAKADEVSKYYSDLVKDYEAIHTGENAGVGHENEAHVHDPNDELQIPYYELGTKGKYTEIDVLTARFYYDGDKKIEAIATDTDIFGFVMGLTSKQEVVNEVGTDGKTINATKDDLKFLSFPSEPMIIHRYELENCYLDFYFYDNALVTALIKIKE
jgi:hypothetical protein